MVCIYWWHECRRTAEHHLRIGQLAGRVGVCATLLRDRERRYGLLEPVRTHHGYRLYSAEDEARVRPMLALNTDGVATQQAARMVISGTAPAAVARAGDASRPTTSRSSGRRSSASTTSRPTPSTTSCSRGTRSGRCSPPLSFRTLPASATGGRAARRRSRRNTSRATCSAGACSACTRLGRGRWAACSPGMSERRASRSRPHLLRDRPRGHGWRITYLGADTPQATLFEAAAGLAPNISCWRRRGRCACERSQARHEVQRCRSLLREEGLRAGSRTSSALCCSTSIRSPPPLG